jgi:cytochrome oxidase Cu insertion factor (SCO1/SenC/PrrC family)
MRKVPRILGVFAGLFAGIIAAILVRGPARQKRLDKLEGSPSAIVQVDSPESSDDSDEDRRPLPPPDPGRRNVLKELVAGAKAQPNWLKEFEFVERSRSAVKSEDLRGEPYVVCFFFTTCPGTCSRQSSKMQLLQNKFKNKPIKFVSISVDPKIDTPEVLSEYADKYQAEKNRWLFLTGKLEHVIQVGTEKFFLSHVSERGHPDRFTLVNAEGDAVGSYDWRDLDEYDQLIEHMNELLNSGR